MRECVILSGGFGTRLSHLIPGLPKSLAPIVQIPFLDYLIRYLIDQRVDHFIFSLGYQHEQIIEFIHSNYPNLHATYCIEESPLGTGGAILNTIDSIESENFFLCNADTYFPIQMNALEKFHNTTHSNLSIAIKPQHHPSRYGTVELDVDSRILQFQEKKSLDYGLINGGTYLINKAYLLGLQLPNVFSFEKEVLEKRVSTDSFFGQVQDVFFLDIGVPEDYELAQKTLPHLDKLKHKKSLFLDRDGVINIQIPNDYVKHWNEFVFREDFIKNISRIFGQFDYVFVVTNQQVIGKEIISIQELNKIHEGMQNEIVKHGGFITKIVYCPHLLSSNCDCRKPKAGMLDQIKTEFSDCSFSNAVFVGDSESDMIAAKSRGIVSVLLQSTHTNFSTSNHADFIISNWDEFNSIDVPIQ
ncbi:MAG: HAD-IIIA family hydrolase [Saprospiraceae bacterium]